MKHFINNVAFQAGRRALETFIPFVTILVVARRLGSTGVGTYQFISQVSSYFVFAVGLGLANYGVREIAFVRNDRRLVETRFSELETLNIITGAVVLVGYLVFAGFTSTPTLYYIVALTLLGSLLDITWFLAGIEKFVYIAVSGIVLRTAGLVIILVVVKTPQDLPQYVLIQSVTVLLCLVILWPVAVRHTRFHWVPIKQALKHLRSATALLASKVLATLYISLTTIVLGLFRSAADVGHYSYAVLIPSTFGRLIGAVDEVLLPRMSHWLEQGKQAAMQRTLGITLHTQLFLTLPAMAGLATVGPTLIMLLLGPDFTPTASITPILAVDVVLIPLSMSISQQYHIPRMLLKSYNISVAVGAIAAIAINLVTVPFIGIWGSVAATLSAQALVALLRVVDAVRKAAVRFDISILGRIAVSVIVMLAAIIGVGFLVSDDVWRVAIQIAVGVATYVGVANLLGVNMIQRALRG